MSLSAALALLLALQAGPAGDASAPPPAPGDAIVGALEGAPADPAPPAATDKPAAEAPAPPPLEFDPHTKVDGGTLQVILGQRALVTLDAKGLPALEEVEDGRLNLAHPAGKVTELYMTPPKGRLAAALDGSAEKKASVLKIWNNLDRAVALRVVALVMRGEALTPVPLSVCPLAAGEIRAQSWPAPIVAVGLAQFRTAGPEALADPACQKGTGK